MANKNILVKSEKIDETGHKIILTREESELKVSQAVFVVEGANLIRNEYGNRLFADFFLFYNRLSWLSCIHRSYN